MAPQVALLSVFATLAIFGYTASTPSLVVGNVVAFVWLLVQIIKGG